MLRRVLLPNLLLTTPRASWINRAYTSNSTQPTTTTITTMAQQQKQQPSLVWIDCEMTGLASTDKLIEIAVIITDDDLNIVAEGPNLIIHQPKEIMDNMNQWCIDHHGAVSPTLTCLLTRSISHSPTRVYSASSLHSHTHILTLPFISSFHNPKTLVRSDSLSSGFKDLNLRSLQPSPPIHQVPHPHTQTRDLGRKFCPRRQSLSRTRDVPHYRTSALPDCGCLDGEGTCEEVVPEGV